MKRKFILLPITLTALAPAISLVGCGDPEVVNPYIVTPEEMESAIKLEGVQYVQYHEESTVRGGTSTKLTKIDAKLSPTVYYSKTVIDNSYYEQYVVKNDDNTYTKYYRESAEEENWTEDYSATSDDFITVEQCGLTMYDSYYQPIDIGVTYSFNDEEKYYSASLGQGMFTQNWSYYFENKKLIKSFLSIGGLVGGSSSTTTFTYDQITPKPPI